MDVNMNSIPLACNMNVFTPAERENHIQNTLQLYSAVQEIHEAPNGYEFLFPCDSETIAKLAEFITNERLCCPFLEFDLKLSPNDQPISLTLTGPEGTREFLREEFREAFA
jgi:hypothetical protein